MLTLSNEKLSKLRRDRAAATDDKERARLDAEIAKWQKKLDAIKAVDGAKSRSAAADAERAAERREAERADILGEAASLGKTYTFDSLTEEERAVRSLEEAYAALIEKAKAHNEKSPQGEETVDIAALEAERDASRARLLEERERQAAEKAERERRERRERALADHRTHAEQLLAIDKKYQQLAADLDGELTEERKALLERSRQDEVDAVNDAEAQKRAAMLRGWRRGWRRSLQRSMPRWTKWRGTARRAGRPGRISAPAPWSFRRA